MAMQQWGFKNYLIPNTICWVLLTDSLLWNNLRQTQIYNVYFMWLALVRFEQCCVFRPANACLRMRSHGQKQYKMLENYQKSMFFIIQIRGSCRAHIEKYFFLDFSRKITEKRLKFRKKVENDWRKCFNQLSGACSTESAHLKAGRNTQHFLVSCFSSIIRSMSFCPIFVGTCASDSLPLWQSCPTFCQMLR